MEAFFSNLFITKLSCLARQNDVAYSEGRGIRMANGIIDVFEVDPNGKFLKKHGETKSKARSDKVVIYGF